MSECSVNATFKNPMKLDQADVKRKFEDSD